MHDDLADALATFRACNYERIYLRPASVAQAKAVVAVLRALVEHYTDRPNLLPCGRTPPDGHPHGTIEAGSEEAVRAAVTYVAGMTDRFAFETAVARLGWDATRLPEGVGLRR